MTLEAVNIFKDAKSFRSYNCPNNNKNVLENAILATLNGKVLIREPLCGALYHKK